MKRKPIKPGSGRAWLIGNSIGHWAEPDRVSLTSDGKPTPEAVPIRVQIVPIHRVKWNR